MDAKPNDVPVFVAIVQIWLRIWRSFLTVRSQFAVKHMAVVERDIEACRLLLSHEADQNLKNEDDKTALFCVFHRFRDQLRRFLSSDPQATESKAKQLIELLLQAGADPQVEWNQSGSVLKVFNNMPDDIRRLLQRTHH